MDGFSYKNVYNSEKHKKFMDSKRYVIDDEFLYEAGNCELSEGFSVEYSIYSDTEQKDKQYSITKAVASKIILKNADKKVYEYYRFNSYSCGFNDIIHHKNGHGYYPFHVDMYGISYLDVDTLEVYNYIPEGYEHNKEYRCGESFIITDVHYDMESNLIAYGGCYWAAPYEVMVGDFSDPLNFNPHLVSLRNISDPEYNYEDIDFKEWKDGRLYILCDKEEKYLSAEELKKLIDELTVKGK